MLSRAWSLGSLGVQSISGRAAAKAAANATTASDLLLSPVASGTTVYYRVYGWNAPTIGKVIGGTNSGVGAAVSTSIILK